MSSWKTVRRWLPSVRLRGKLLTTQYPEARPQVEKLEDRLVMDGVPGSGVTTPPTLSDPNLQATTVLSATQGLTQPIGIVFLGSVDDYLVLEKASGRVKRVLNGTVQGTPVLDLAVNSNSERGLLSLTLHPNFSSNNYVYVRWTESSTGADSTINSAVPLFGNRVDRYIWNGSTLTFDRNIIQLRARQADNVDIPGHEGIRNNNENGNHNGGVIRFGPDGKLYIFMGDLGRRGWLQNLPRGPFLTAPFVDDTLGGPAPDNAHLAGVVLRLNDDGSAPTDNPFFASGATMGGEVGANIQKIYSYGHRNGFGMAFDPVSGALWVTENADDAYSEINRVIPGMNGGWIQFSGPASRMNDWKFIETTQFNSALQQVRYPPTRAAYTSALALSRMYMLPGATYVDPDLSWRYENGPSGTAFVTGNALGAEYEGTLWIGSARANVQVGANGGSLYRLKLTADRLHIDVSADPRLADRVADNLFRAQKFEGTESETLKIGTFFGTTTDIVQGPDGNLYVVSITDNSIYRISRQSIGVTGGGGSVPGAFRSTSLALLPGSTTGSIAAGITPPSTHSASNAPAAPIVPGSTKVSTGTARLYARSIPSTASAVSVDHVFAAPGLKLGVDVGSLLR